MKTSRGLRTTLAALTLVGGLSMTAACTVEDDDPDGTTVVEDDGGGGEDAPDVNIENENEAPDTEESPG